ncbi:hypothetical protein GEMRC1_000538 [Eukaryota sp. GEM-RC1]
MPLHVNNVDVVVSSNFLFGFVSLINSYHNRHQDVSELLTPTMEQMLIDTIDFLSFAFKSGRAASRPDLVFIYYPTPVAALDFIGRLKFILLRTSRTSLFQEYPVLKKLLLRVEDVSMTLTNILIDGLTCVDNECFAFHFLGQGDHHPEYRDRVFCSALTLNTLLDLWTDGRREGGRVYLKNTPYEVRHRILQLYNFILQRFDSERLENSFFSGSIKGFSTLPWSYPGNHAEMLDGTLVDVHKPFEGEMTELIYGMKGKVSGEQYAKMLKESYFGFPKEPDFHGFNESPFPFWSCDSLTRAFSILAVTKFENSF